jgi:hypothetical protein
MEKDINFITRYIDFHIYYCDQCNERVQWQILTKIIMLQQIYSKIPNFDISDIIIKYINPLKNFCSSNCNKKYRKKYPTDYIICKYCNEFVNRDIMSIKKFGCGNTLILDTSCLNCSYKKKI